MTKALKLAMTAGLVLGTILGAAASYAAPNASKYTAPNAHQAGTPSFWDSPVGKQFYPDGSNGRLRVLWVEPLWGHRVK